MPEKLATVDFNSNGDAWVLWVSQEARGLNGHAIWRARRINFSTNRYAERCCGTMTKSYDEIQISVFLHLLSAVYPVNEASGPPCNFQAS